MIDELFGINEEKFKIITPKMYEMIGQHHFATVCSMEIGEFLELQKRYYRGEQNLPKQSYEQTIINLKQYLLKRYGKTLDGKINTHLISLVNNL